MNPNDVIESYVVDVMRRLPGKSRNEVGFELRGLLGEMLAERSHDGQATAEDAVVLAMLRGFGSPADVALRYQAPGWVIIPAEHTRSFALWSLGGIALQWGLTLPRVFEGSLRVETWWFTWGLGSLWWPGFLAMMFLAGAWLREMPGFRRGWQPKTVDSERVNRASMAFAFAGMAIAVVLMTCLPWITGLMPDPLPRVLAFDPTFLGERALPVMVLWFAGLALSAFVLVKGRHSPLTRKLELIGELAFVILLAWWIAAGAIFQQQPTDEGAKAALGFVILILLVDVAIRVNRQRTRIRTPKIAG